MSKKHFFGFLAFIFSILFSISKVYSSDFIVPNSSGEPITIDVSNLSLTSGIDVTIGGLSGQPRPYRDSNNRSLVIFPSAFASSEKTIEIKSGNSTITKTISFRPSPQGTLKSSLLPGAQEARANNTITKISDGRVVLIGGSKGLVDTAVDTLEIFNPESGKSERLKTANGLANAKLKIPRSAHTATYIGISESPIGMISGPVEQILIAGGFSTESIIQDSLEILEIKVGTNQSVSTTLSSKKAKLKKGRIFHTANLLPDGRVVFIGGQGRISMTALGAISSIEVFDPSSRSIVASGIALITPRILHTATNLQDGNILIVGGFTNDEPGNFGLGMATQTCELINTGTFKIKNVDALVDDVGTGGHSATLLTNGLVLVAGGSSDFFSEVKDGLVRGITKNTLQFFDPSTESFAPIQNKSGANLTLQTPRFLHSAILLPNGNLAFIGGSNIKQVNSTSLIASPISLIEVINPDLISYAGSLLKAEAKTNLDTYNGRILPTAILVTPKTKTSGFFLSSDIDTYVNSGIYLTGGYTNGFGTLPSKSSEFIQNVSSNSVEGRKLKLSPEGLIGGSYVRNFIVQLDNFSKVPALQTNPQAVNLSTSNNFKQDIKVLSTNNEDTLLKAIPSSSSVIVSPSLFQVGETISISRKDTSVNGEFEILIEPSVEGAFFIPAKVKVSVSDVAKPFLASVSGFGISISNESGNNSDTVKLKILSQDGSSEISSIPTSTQVTATIANPEIANLGGLGISSVTGNLSTQFIVNGVKPGNTAINFTIDSSDILGLSLPVQISGTPSFASIPIDINVLSGLLSGGVNISSANKLNSTTFSLDDVRLSPSSSVFPFYVPIGLISSIDGSNKTGTFTLRPLFGIDLLTAVSRTLVNPLETDFRTTITEEPSSLAAIVSSDSSIQPIALFGLSDGLKGLTFENDTTKNLNQSLNKLNGITGLTDLEAFEFFSPGNLKIVALKENMLSFIDGDTGDADSTASLSAIGNDVVLTKINGQDAAVVAVGRRGVDLIFPITDIEPRVVNFQLPGDTESIAVVDELSNVAGPFVISYDGLSNISIANLVDLEQNVQTIEVGSQKINKIAYAGRFSINGSLVDLVVASTSRKLILIDITNNSIIPVVDTLKIKTNIEDLVVIDGVAYLALGTGGISAISIGSLLDGNSTKAEITVFKENRLLVNKANGIVEIKTKPINAKKLKAAKPYLLASGTGNPISIIKVVP